LKGEWRALSMQQIPEVLEIIDLDLNKKDMIVLGALLKAQNEPTAFVDFESLREQLAKDEGGKKGKDSLIYRSLSWLEQAGLIRVDRSGHKHGYNSNVGMMYTFLKHRIKAKTSDLAKETRTIDAEIQIMSEINVDSLVADIIALASGTKLVDRPVFAQGWQNIIKLLDDKIYRNVKKNDIIRFTLEWYNQPEELEESRVDRIEEMLKMGVEIRGLEHRKPEKKRFQRFTQRNSFYLQKGYKAGLRVCLRKDSTYQFIGRNSEGILLIVSENPLSATWLPRDANPELVDNAIETFDTDYNTGKNIEYVGGE
jgi:predicted transcriptional regulator